MYVFFVYDFRPDNWVFYDSLKEEPALPKIPDLNMDFSPSSEIPKPIRENFWLSLANVSTKTRLAVKPNEIDNNTNTIKTASRSTKNHSHTITNQTTEAPTLH